MLELVKRQENMSGVFPDGAVAAEKIGKGAAISTNAANTPKTANTAMTVKTESVESSESPEKYNSGGKEIFGTSAPPQVKEIKFFTAPKTVKKKTEGEIIAFQVAFTVLFCLAYKLTALFSPELYMNISAYLERLFGW